MNYIFILISLIVSSASYARDIDPSEGARSSFIEVDSGANATVIEAAPSAGLMIMKSKPKKTKKKIDRSKGFYLDKKEVELLEKESPAPKIKKEELDREMESEEKEISNIVTNIKSNMIDKATADKMSRVKDDFQLDNPSLEDIEDRYNRLKKIDSTPREPSASEEAEISPY